MRHRVHLYVAAACVAALSSLPADAAPITQFKYDVLSGTFGGGGLAGPVSGGTMVFTPTLPISPGGPSQAGTLFIQLSGTAGVFSVAAPAFGISPLTPPHRRFHALLPCYFATGASA